MPPRERSRAEYYVQRRNVGERTQQCEFNENAQKNKTVGKHANREQTLMSRATDHDVRDLTDNDGCEEGGHGCAIEGVVRTKSLSIGPATVVENEEE